MTDNEFEGLGQEDHWALYELQDHWQKEALKVNTRSPKTGKIKVAWNQVSPSQIENYVKCKRAWFFKSVARIPEPQKGHQALGTSFHLIMEKVPKGLSWPVKEDTNASPEEWDKANQMANQALPLLPIDPQGMIKREHGIVLPTYEGGPLLKGYIDLALPPGIGWPAFMVPASEAIIGDYKTLSDFRYMKTPQELAESIQMMSYAKWAITDWPSGLVGPTDPLPEHVRLLHIYARTKGPYSRSSIRHESAVVTVPEIESFWSKTLDTVREMQSTATCQSGEDVEATGALTGHCEAYGGCYFRDRCGLTKDTGTVKSLFQIGKKPQQTTPDNNMSGSPVLAKIIAARAAASGQTPNNTSQAQASSDPAPVAASISEAPIPQSTQTPGAVGSVNASAAVPEAIGEPSAGNSASTSGGVAAAPIQPKGPISGLMSKIEAQGKGWPALGGSVAQAYGKEMYGQPMQGLTGAGELGKTMVMTVGDLMKLAQGIIPPDAPPRTQAVITTPGMAVADPEAEPSATSEEGEEDEVSTPAQATSPGPVSTPGSGVPDQAPAGATPASQTVQQGSQIPVTEKKRGRPSKEEMQAREAAAQAEFNAKVEAEVTRRMANVGNVVQGGNVQCETASLVHPTTGETLEQIYSSRAELDRQLTKAREDLGNALRSANTGRSTEDGLTLYVDCLPVKGSGELTDFHEWIAPACQAVAEAQGVSDWRLINYVGKGLLATQVRELIKLTGLPKAMAIPGFAAGADIALEILSPLAKKIVRKLG